MQAVVRKYFPYYRFFCGFTITTESINYIFLNDLIVYERGRVIWYGLCKISG